MYLRLKALDGLEGPEVRDRLSSLPSNQEASHWDELPLDSLVISAATSQLPATAGSEACSSVGLPHEAQPSLVRPPPDPGGRVKGGRDNRRRLLALDSVRFGEGFQ